ncbi:MAG: 50S ribosomal protein L29 [Candidatus Pacearchaeota archaeon]|jgi:ribosomal protein L29
MAKIKASEIKKMTKEEKNQKLEELKMELIKSRVSASKTGNSKVKEIKRLIARITTLNK